jgi:hypothetical protein
MSKPERQATVEKLSERVLFTDILKQQMLDLKALRREVAKAELRLMPPRRRAPARRRFGPMPSPRPEKNFMEKKRGH